VKLIVDTTDKHVTVSKVSEPKADQNGQQKTERGTGRLIWSTQVFVLDEEGGHVLTVATAGEKPELKVGQTVVLSKLEALPWSSNGRSGIAFRALEITPSGGPSVKAVKEA
jgi:hypothetical protein